MRERHQLEYPDSGIVGGDSICDFSAPAYCRCGSPITSLRLRESSRSTCQEVHHETPPHMGPWPSKVGKDLLLGAAGILKGVGENGEANPYTLPGQ